MTLNKRERALVIVTVVVLVGLGNWLLLAPLVRSLRALGEQTRTQQQVLTGYVAVTNQVPTWRAEYDALRHQLGQQVEQFDQASQVLQKIEQVAAAAGVAVVSRRPLPVVDRDVYRELPVQCRVESTTESLVKFLFALRTGSGFINIDSLQINPQPNNPNVLRCDIEIRALSGKSGRPAS